MSPYCGGDVVELVESARARVALEPGRRAGSTESIRTECSGSSGPTDHSSR